MFKILRGYNNIMKLTQFFKIIISILKKIKKINCDYIYDYLPLKIIVGDYTFIMFYCKHIFETKFKWHIHLTIDDIHIDTFDYGDKVIMNILKQHTIDDKYVRASITYIEDDIMDMDITDKLKDKLIYTINKKNREF